MCRRLCPCTGGTEPIRGHMTRHRSGGRNAPLGKRTRRRAAPTSSAERPAAFRLSVTANPLVGQGDLQGCHQVLRAGDRVARDEPVHVDHRSRTSAPSSRGSGSRPPRPGSTGRSAGPRTRRRHRTRSGCSPRPAWARSPRPTAQVGCVNHRTFRVPHAGRADPQPDLAVAGAAGTGVLVADRATDRGVGGGSPRGWQARRARPHG